MKETQGQREREGCDGYFGQYWTLRVEDLSILVY